MPRGSSGCSRRAPRARRCACGAGRPLADVADEPFAAAEIRRLEELRASALEVAIDQDLDAGRHREVLPELEALLAQEPLRERLHAQRMLALYRSGRQAEALEAYREARATLVEQIGVEPGPELRRLHEAILRQDPSLDPPGQEPSRRRRWSGAMPSLRTCAVSGAGLAPARARACSSRDRRGSARRGSCRSSPTRCAATAARVAYGELAARCTGRRCSSSTTSRSAPEVAAGPARPGRRDGGRRARARRCRWRRSGATTSPRLARYHAGARAAVEPPVDRLLAESGGVPARVHRAAAAWARAVATRRVGEAAARASAERAGWHLAGDDVADRGRRAADGPRARAARRAPAPCRACPFKGLASFDVEDARCSSAASGSWPTWSRA